MGRLLNLAQMYVLRNINILPYRTAQAQANSAITRWATAEL
jgi:hypothetical protein